MPSTAPVFDIGDAPPLFAAAATALPATPPSGTHPPDTAPQACLCVATDRTVRLGPLGMDGATTPLARPFSAHQREPSLAGLRARLGL